MVEELPELMFFYHNYARLEGELEGFSKLQCKTALITSGTLRSRINSGKYNFTSIVYGPMTMRKVIRIFAESKIEKPILVENVLEEEKVEETRSFENVRAMVAENNAISQKIITNILKSFSVEVFVAEDGLKAFEMRREHELDIIFMDMDMPVMDGPESISKILYYEGINQLSHTPIISLGTLNEEMVDHSGIDGFINKPFDADEIYNIVHKFCVEMPKEKKAQEEDDFIAKVLSDDFLKEDS